MQIKIQTLTPLHIGSGIELQGNFEYLHFPKEECLAVVDPEKVLKVLGEDHLEAWMTCIVENKSLMPVLQGYKSDLKATDVAIRTIHSPKAFTKPIKEQMRLSGNNKPLLPGSSLKGALRTALFSKLLMDNKQLAKERRNFGNADFRGGFRWSDQPLQKTFFGEDPNRDIFRLLQVGDSTFEKAETTAYKIETINKKFDRYEIKQELTQYVEAVPAGANAVARIQFNEALDKRARSNFNGNAHKLRLDEFFPLINLHTIRLLEDDINYWDETVGNPDALADGVQEMERVAAIANACAANECVVRVGWGSGFRSMTGDWHGAMTDEDYDQLLKAIRPKHPLNLIFPKSMRFVSGGTPLGFIKLSF